MSSCPNRDGLWASLPNEIQSKMVDRRGNAVGRILRPRRQALPGASAVTPFANMKLTSQHFAFGPVAELQFLAGWTMLRRYSC
jgi:hypothetical protein